jgi:hypothetical protein
VRAPSTLLSAYKWMMHMNLFHPSTTSIKIAITIVPRRQK